jgi:hypothetical protein
MHTYQKLRKLRLALSIDLANLSADKSFTSHQRQAQADLLFAQFYSYRASILAGSSK